MSTRGTITEHRLLVALAKRVAALNPAAGEIGAGMLASLVEDARTALGIDRMQIADEIVDGFARPPIAATATVWRKTSARTTFLVTLENAKQYWAHTYPRSSLIMIESFATCRRVSGGRIEQACRAAIARIMEA